MDENSQYKVVVNQEEQYSIEVLALRDYLIPRSPNPGNF
jgi:hypothetical protein